MTEPQQKTEHRNLSNDDEESEWSLSSLEELKGLDLNEIKDEEEREEPPKPKQQERANKIEPKYPPMQSVGVECKFFEMGKVVQKVGQLLIVEANNCLNLVDLDNWLFSSGRKCLGFVIDIFGRVDNPFYAVKLLEEVEREQVNWQELIGLPLFYAEGCKTLTEDDINSIKEKSSVYKEADCDSESSDDEQEDSEPEMRSNVLPRHREPPRRKASFEEEPYHNRDRTREKRHHPRNQEQPRRPVDPRQQARDRQHNQMYLESMYNMYYSQMMQLYNGGQSGMPMPLPPVYPPYQQHPMYPQPPYPPQPPQPPQ